MPTYNDGSIPYGFPGLVGIDTTGTDAESPNEFYSLESITTETAGSEIERRSGLNVVTGRVLIPDMNDGIGVNNYPTELSSATVRLQRATITQPFPPIGSLFLMEAQGPGVDLIATSEGRQVWCVASGGQNYAQAEAHTFEVVCRPTQVVL
jgi:hypothetical protein